jgi:hypothetical protein
MASNPTEIQFLQDTMRDYNNVCDQLKEYESAIQPLKLLKTSLDEAINIYSIQRGVTNIVLPPNSGSSISNKQLVQKRSEKTIGFNKQLVYSCIEDVLQEYPELIKTLLNEIESRLTTKETITMRLENIKRSNSRNQKAEKDLQEHEEISRMLEDDQIDHLIPEDMRN